MLVVLAALRCMQRASLPCPHTCIHTDTLAIVSLYDLVPLRAATSVDSPPTPRPLGPASHGMTWSQRAPSAASASFAKLRIDSFQLQLLPILLQIECHRCNLCAKPRMHQCGQPSGFDPSVTHSVTTRWPRSTKTRKARPSRSAASGQPPRRRWADRRVAMVNPSVMG